MAEQVKVLKKFRDNVLLTKALGRRFVEFYYKVSPPMANFIAKHDNLRMLVRWVLLPVVGISWLALRLGHVPTAALVGLLLSLMAGATVVCYRKVLQHKALTITDLRRRGGASDRSPFL